MSRLCRLILLAATGFFGFALVRLGIQFPPGVCLLAVLAALRRMRGWTNSGSHGTARIATIGDLASGGLLADGSECLTLGTTEYTPPATRSQAVRALLSPGIGSDRACRLFLSSWFGGRWDRGNLIRVSKFAHIMAVAATRRGKGTSLAVPALQSFAGSMVIVDLKGELHSLTAAHRRKAFMHDCYRFDPFRLCGSGGDRINPLDFIDAGSPEFLDNCKILANAFVVRTPGEKDPHWPDSAEILISCMIVYVCAIETDPRRRNLNTVRELLSSRQQFEAAGAKMRATPGFGGVVRRMGEQMTHYIERELGSVMTTINRFTNVIDGPLIAECFSGSDFDPLELRGKASVYLILPQKTLSTHKYVLRLWLATILHRLTGGVPSEKHPVLLLLDEAGHYCGQMQILEDATTIMTGYGINLFYIFQSLGQIRECYGDRASKILDNIDTQIYFGISSPESCKAVSEMAGEATILVDSTQEGTDVSHSHDGPKDSVSRSRSRSSTLSETGRALFTPDEVRRLPEDAAILIHRNVPVALCKRLNYYDHPAFKGGRTGSRDVGLGTVLAASLLLACGTFVAAFVASLPEPGTGPRPAFVADGQGTTLRYPAYSPSRPAGRFSRRPLPPQRYPVWQPSPHRPRVNPGWQSPPPRYEPLPGGGWIVRF